MIINALFTSHQCYKTNNTQMRRLNLHIDKMVQGEFHPKKLNLLLLFQVNCPGCFVYALPTFNQLYEKYNQQIGFIALSTAFENFDLNTHQNTKLLVDKGELIGETKKALHQQGIELSKKSLGHFGKSQGVYTSGKETPKEWQWKTGDKDNEDLTWLIK